MRLGTMSWVIWVGYCNKGDPDLIRSLIFWCIPAPAASTIVDHEDKTTKSEILEKDILVEEKLVRQLSQTRCIKDR